MEKLYLFSYQKMQHVAMFKPQYQNQNNSGWYMTKRLSLH